MVSFVTLGGHRGQLPHPYAETPLSYMSRGLGGLLVSPQIWLIRESPESHKHRNWWHSIRFFPKVPMQTVPKSWGAEVLLQVAPVT